MSRRTLPSSLALALTMAWAPGARAAPPSLDLPGLAFLRVNEQGFEEYRWEKDRAEMVLVPEGAAPLGDPQGPWYERPVREVTTSAYLIDKYEVTVERYARFLASHEHRLPPGWQVQQRQAKNPVTAVSWFDADMYALRSGKRLPTEAEWERAARGPDARPYPWGRKAPEAALANFDATGTRDRDDWRRWIGTRSTHLPGTSPFGVVNMVGNVAEWCHDWFAQTTYRTNPDRDPRGPSSGFEKVLRGGSMFSPAADLRAARRDHASPADEHPGLGFRTALSVADVQRTHDRALVAGMGVATEEGSTGEVLDRIDPITETPDPVRWADRPDDAPALPGFQYQRTNSRGHHEYLWERDRFVMVLVPGGTFSMGSPDELDLCERPVRRVTVSPFLIGKYEVTVGEYAKFLTASGRERPARWGDQFQHPDRPVAWVSWEDAQAYAAWAGMALPSEAQWEFAARGEAGQRFPWGDADPTPERAVCGAEWSGDEAQNEARVRGRLRAGQSPHGAYDMAGNVWEWTAGWFGCRYAPGPQTDPTGRRMGRKRVARGGSWREACGNDHKATTRLAFFPQERHQHLGFRVVKPLAR